MNEDVTGTQQAAPHTEASLSALVGGIINDAQRLLSQQIELIRVELKDDLRRVVKGVAYIAGGAGLLAIGGLLLFFGVCFLVAELLHIPQYGGFLIVGGALLLVGAICLYMAVRKFSRAVPEQTLTALKENLQWKTNVK